MVLKLLLKHMYVVTQSIKSHSKTQRLLEIVEILVYVNNKKVLSSREMLHERFSDF